MWDTACHNAPKFKTFTYGDSGANGRAYALAQLRRGDALLFLARLQEYIEGARVDRSGFYLKGGLLVDHAGFLTPTSKGLGRFSNNAHAIRGTHSSLVSQSQCAPPGSSTPSRSPGRYAIRSSATRTAISGPGTAANPTSPESVPTPAPAAACWTPSTPNRNSARKC